MIFPRPPLRSRNIKICDGCGEGLGRHIHTRGNLVVNNPPSRAKRTSASFICMNASNFDAFTLLVIATRDVPEKAKHGNTSVIMDEAEGKTQLLESH